MKELTPNGGIPRSVLFAMAVIGGLTVANLYYNQPLLEAIRPSLGATELKANFITFITQTGYALGLILVVPLTDKVSRRKIITVNMSFADWRVRWLRVASASISRGLASRSFAQV